MKPHLNLGENITAPTEDFKMKPNIILIGAPGSGKGTQSEKLISQFGYEHISTGDLLREEIAKSSDLGKRVSSILAQGNLVDDNTVLELLTAKCQLSNHYYIFDGFPRNLEQAKLLEDLLLRQSAKFIAIYLEIDIPTVVTRISQRRICSNCKQVYSLLNLSVDELSVCRKCGNKGTVIQRKDDMPSVVENRMQIFSDSIKPMLDFYDTKNVLKLIDAAETEDIVFEKISNIIEIF
jgi:adenylate kinase